MEKVYWLDQIKLQDRAKIGDKAFYLSRIVQRGYSVVPGFVISAEVLRQFLETINSSESLAADLPDSSLHLDVTNWRQLQLVAGRLRQEIMAATVPPHWVSKVVTAAREWQSKYLILRPSVSVSNAGQWVRSTPGLMESIFCGCDEDAIALALKRTWSQLFRAKSLLYWQRLGIDLQQINLAVLVQPIQNAIASGSLNVDSSGWTIEATWGLGMALTRGEVLPDMYYIQQETGIVLERHLGNKLLAYRLDDGTEKSDPSILQSVLTYEDTTLVAHLVTEDQQKQYALTEQDLQRLIALGNQLVSELGKTFTVKWTISDAEPVSHLQITEVSTPPLAIPNLHLIKGLGAATGRVTATAYVINSLEKPENIPQGVVLVVPAIAPDWLSLMHQVVAIVTAQGGLTSHAAILARELSIPAVVSAKDATTLIQTGEKLLVDGDRGEVYRLRESKTSNGENQVVNSTIPAFSSYHPVNQATLPMIATQLLVNLSQPSLIERSQNLPVDGVGLLRSELMLLNILEGRHPSTWVLEGRRADLLELWSQQIMQFVRAFTPRLVFYRSLDWRFHEFPSLSHTSASTTHSILGDRGTFSYVNNPAVFELELAALATVQKAGYSNLRLLLPFVRNVSEFTFCRHKVEQAGLTQVSQFQLWIMAEVPSVLFLLPEYVKAGVAGISIGTNDLTQLLLGVDREQGQLTKIFDERHPAVMGAIAQLIQMANKAGIPCSICGQAPALYPEIIDQLVEWGITSISVEPEAVERTHQAIARAEQRLLLAAARRKINS
ncbi:phosphoenolpyruvate synthase [Nostoc sp. FACHB-152]|uniref:putative PEP-binding protein n=1 Tax=unclassified Nostoc TaxID=2593658 RepID=UPI001681C8BD|nr:MULTISPECIES: putative PEP-binding protein [unclassified Nostoc]MBD2447298.1 phosphoenolpyruvate synthase [Nostoc sp. FACHB-152]MBD2468101.1 phosphoenolpyruvate synthase [Nostoc sp. FACHB-145]